MPNPILTEFRETFWNADNVELPDHAASWLKHLSTPRMQHGTFMTGAGTPPLCSCGWQGRQFSGPILADHQRVARANVAHARRVLQRLAALINRDGCSMVPEDGEICTCDDNPYREGGDIVTNPTTTAPLVSCYCHTDENGVKRIVYSDGTDRWYFEGDSKLVLPYPPSSVHGRYFFDQIKNGMTRRQYRRYHHDYMLPDPPPYGSWEAKITFPYRSYFRTHSVISPF